MLPPPAGYPAPDTELPPDLIVRFWEDVYAALQSEHGLTPADAMTAIIRHRADEYLVGDMQYHQDAEDVAETIAIGWHNGALNPQAAVVPVPVPPPAATAPATPPTTTSP